MDDNEFFEEQPQIDEDALSDTEKLELALQLIEGGEFAHAQQLLDKVASCAEKYYVQGTLFRKKAWVNEARKCFKNAIKADPDNEKYKSALDELESFKKSDEFKSTKRQMGKDNAMECCIMGFCECCGTGICESICDGCS